MIVPRPPGWHTDPRILVFRAWWHRHRLPCLFCLVEGKPWR